MFNNLKSTITDLAFSAVTMAEETLATASGTEKKTAAIDDVISMIPVPAVFKSIISFVLSRFIDEAIEKAVEYMNSIKNPEA